MELFASILNDPRTRALSKVLAPHGALYLVGGAVRDALLGKESKDLDFAYSKSPREIVALLEAADIKVIPTGLSHQTVTVKLDDELPHVELTSFRNSDIQPEGGVYLGKDIYEDLECRDFTVNAMALSVSDEDSILIDPLGGAKDIERNILRTPGSPERRFLEDPLRILRMVRFASSLNFSIEPVTLSTALTLSEKLLSVSPERIRDEFIKILLADTPRAGVLLLKDMDFFKMFLPEMEACVDFEQNSYHKHDVFLHTIDVLELASRERLVRLAAFFHDIGKPPSLSIDEKGERHFYLHEKIGRDMIPSIGERLRFSNDLSDAIQKLVYTHMRPLDAGAGGLRRILRDTDPYYKEWRALKYADTAAVLGETPELLDEFKNFDDRISRIQNSEALTPFRKLAISGKDLIALGFVPGPLFKEILAFLHERVLDQPECNTREQLLTLIKENFKSVQ